jgi:hypothetical protein
VCLPSVADCVSTCRAEWWLQCRVHAGVPVCCVSRTECRLAVPCHAVCPELCVGGSVELAAQCRVHAGVPVCCVSRTKCRLAVPCHAVCPELCGAGVLRRPSCAESEPGRVHTDSGMSPECFFCFLFFFFLGGVSLVVCGQILSGSDAAAMRVLKTRGCNTFSRGRTPVAYVVLVFVSS